MCAALVLGSVGPALAQGSVAPRPPHRFEISAGAGISGGTSLGGTAATLRTNSLQPQPYRLFSVDSRIARAPAAEARVGYAVTRRIDVEARVAYARPQLRASVTTDAEGAAAVTAVERFDQYLIDAGVAVTLDRFRAGRLVPFAAGGAGYVRQLHEGQTVIEQGRLYYVGVGVRLPLRVRDRGFAHSVGVRGDVRLEAFDGGISFEDALRWRPSASASVWLGL